MIAASATKTAAAIRQTRAFLGGNEYAFGIIFFLFDRNILLSYIIRARRGSVIAQKGFRKMRVTLLSVAFAALMTAVPAAAQDVPDTVETAFVGGLAGPEAGVTEHYFVIEATAPGFPPFSSRFGDWDIGGGIFAGYDVPVGRRIRLGVEAGLNVGGGAPEADFAGAIPYSQKPRWGYRLAGRAGYVVDRRTMAYATIGYGAQRYRVFDPFAIGNGNWRENVVLGGGIEHRLSRRIGARLDYRNVPGVTQQIMLGLPIRF